MCRELLHIYGPISICGYGVMIFLGLLLFAYLVNKDPVRKTIMSSEAFADILVMGTFIGLIGGRVLFIATNWSNFEQWYDYIAVWDGGFSLLGSIVGNLLFLPPYLRRRHIPVLPFFDLVAIYAPLLIAISRIGCFWSGCCYGMCCNKPWAIIYTDVGGDAPCGVPLHPTQLYSALSLFIIFLFMRFVVTKRIYHAGQAIMIFLLLSSLERFMVDFWRADREFLSFDHAHVFSLHQYISLGLMIGAVIGLIVIFVRSRQRNHESL